MSGKKSRFWTISNRLRVMVALAIVGLVVLTIGILRSEYTLLLEERQAAVRQTVEVAHTIIAHQQKLAAAGTISVEQAKQQAMAEVKALRYSGGEYFFIIDSHPHVIMHPIKPELDGTDVTNTKDTDGIPLFVEFVKAAKAGGSGFVSYHWPKPGEAKPVPKLTYVKEFAAWDWIVGSGVYIDTVETVFRQRATGFLVAVGVLSILLLLFGRAIANSIIRPLREAVSVARHVADGDLTKDFGPIRDDEVGELMQALAEMSQSLCQIVSEVRAGTQNIASVSSQIAAGNMDLSGRTEQQAASLEETASSMEEMTATVRQNADSAHQAEELVNAASSVAVRGGQVVGQVVGTMDSINASSKRIVDIISVIDGIAFQTNILALNAAVEAARAGEQGRGFAVVATEVRTLAQRSAAAAKEIKFLIDDSVDKVAAGTRLVDQAGATMQEIVESVARVNSIMSEMNNAGREQSAGIDQINLAITDLDRTTQQNAALVEQAAAASQALQDQAQDLERVVSVFKVPGNGLAHAPQAKSEKWALSSTPSARKPAAARKLRIAA